MTWICYSCLWATIYFAVQTLATQNPSPTIRGVCLNNVYRKVQSWYSGRLRKVLSVHCPNKIPCRRTYVLVNNSSVFSLDWSTAQFSIHAHWVSQRIDIIIVRGGLVVCRSDVVHPVLSRVETRSPKFWQPDVATNTHQYRTNPTAVVDSVHIY